MAPLPGTRTIPLGWSMHHTEAAAGGMNATVTIGSPGPRVRNPETDRTSQTYTDAYTGPARIEEMNQGKALEWVGQEITGRAYLVQVEFSSTELERGQRLKVLTAHNDAQLVDRVLWLVDVRLGSERFTRDLVVSDTQQGVPPAGGPA